MQEQVADAPVRADGRGHLLHVGADLLAQVRYLIDEADLKRQKRVGGVLGQFRRLAADEHHRRIAQAERLIDALHDGAGPFVVVEAHQHPVRMGEVEDGRAFAEKFGVRADREFGVRTQLAQAALDLAAGAHGDGGLGGDDRETGEVRRQVFHRLEDIAQVGVAVAPAHRRAHGQENQIGVGHGGGEVGGKGDAAGLDVARREARPRPGS